MNRELALEMKLFFEGLLADLDNLSESELGRDNLLNLGKVSSGDDGDRAMDEREKALSIRLQARRTFYKKKIQRALDKINEGIFGECEECSAEISEERLRARPTATLCIHCKEEQEQVEVQIPYRKRSHTLGKEIISA